MNISREEVLKIAKISKIDIQEDEIKGLTQQLQEVLNYAECVKKAAGELMDQPSNKNVNFFREDVVIKSNPETILKQSPEREGNYFVVPKILDSK